MESRGRPLRSIASPAKSRISNDRLIRPDDSAGASPHSDRAMIIFMISFVPP